ncbi:hypothetical protein BKP37_16440 [Anaerobacillus alkalilacustris]|uniref:Uncharacterized protein n=1 Tax=Anaerobacillus alkalilacustris TaxID=393763 RepID=A0A1S2LFD3_9BACI|nr:hypothetical protein [Anaerobacillus alkalilacustris]OIJ11232.1 hypothetical protein BKP37_16440 [Anaerobacillus alkalilacustris]
MNYDQMKQFVLLTQDATALGWEFSIEEGKLQAFDENYSEDPITFQDVDQFLEWLENQFDKTIY